MQKREFTRWALLAAIVVAYAVHDAWVVAYLNSADEWPLQLCYVMGLGESALLGAWAVLGPRTHWLQVPRMLLLLAAMIAIPFLGTIEARPWSIPSFGRLIVFMFHVTSFSAACLLFGTLRAIWHWRFLPWESCGAAEARTLKRQMTLRGIFLDMLLASLVMALLRHVPIDFWVEVLDVKLLGIGLVWVIVLGSLQLPMIPIVRLVMCEKRQGVVRSIVASVSSFIVIVASYAALMVLISPGDLSDLPALTVATVFIYFGATATLFVLRLAGYRLATRKTLLDMPAAHAKATCWPAGFSRGQSREQRN